MNKEIVKNEYIVLRKCVEQGLLIKISDKAPKFKKYKLSNNTLLENLNSSKK